MKLFWAITVYFFIPVNKLIGKTSRSLEETIDLFSLQIKEQLDDEAAGKNTFEIKPIIKGNNYQNKAEKYAYRSEYQ